MIHFYKRNYGMRSHYSYERKESFKLLCMGDARIPLEQLDERPTSVMHNTSCPACLDVLIPKKEKELAKMLANRQLNLKSEPKPEVPDHAVLIQGGQ